MNISQTLDCIVIGYNEVPFQHYESFLRNYGENSEAYRDLKFSFVDMGGVKMDYVGLLNHVLRAADPRRAPGACQRLRPLADRDGS